VPYTPDPVKGSLKTGLFFFFSQHKKSKNSFPGLIFLSAFAILLAFNPGAPMKGEYIIDKISDLKSKFQNFFQHRKQITALENHSLVKKFSDAEQEVFGAIKYCMTGSFLHEEDATWISSKLNRLQINYLDWAYKTNWLKSQMGANRKPRKPEYVQTFFDFSKKQPTPNIPVELLASQPSTQISARI
jgi:hypothetical protein